MNNIDRMDLFPVPIFGAEFDNSEELRKVMMPILRDIEDTDPDPHIYSAKGYTNYNPAQQIIDRPELEELRNFIFNIGMNANETIGLKSNLMFTGSWFSINRLYSTHLPHNHIPSTWSGVYYVQATEEDATLTFIDKNKECSWPWASNMEITAYTTPQFSIKPKTGRLIIFPSYLQHLVAEQKVDAERATISFNMAITMDDLND